jgi:hypothetical protein
MHETIKAGPDVGQGGTGPTRGRITSWRSWPNDAGTVLGWIDAELPSGIIVHGCKLMAGPKDRHWISPPSQKIAVDDNGDRATGAPGRAAWKAVISFRDCGVLDHFGDLVLDLSRRNHPEAFDDGGAS